MTTPEPEALPAEQTPTPEMVAAVKSTASNLAILALVEDPAERRALVGTAVAVIVNAGPELSLAVMANLVGTLGNALIGQHGSPQAAMDAVLCDLAIEATDG